MISSNGYIFVLAVPLVLLKESIFTALFPCFLLHIPLQSDFHFHFLFPFQGPSRKQNLSNHLRSVFPCVYIIRCGSLPCKGTEMGKEWQWWNSLAHPEIPGIRPGAILYGLCLETLRVIGIAHSHSNQNGQYHYSCQLMAWMLME